MFITRAPGSLVTPATLTAAATVMLVSAWSEASVVSSSNAQLFPQGSFLVSDPASTTVFTSPLGDVSLTGFVLRLQHSSSPNPGAPGTPPQVGDFDGDGVVGLTASGSLASLTLSFAFTNGSGSGFAALTYIGGFTARTTGNGGNRQTMDLDLHNLDFLSSPAGMQIRMDTHPGLTSIGKCTIDTLAGGQFRIDSYFDVFFELTLDGGQNWLPAQSAMRLSLVPSPGAGALMGLGMILIPRRRRT